MSEKRPSPVANRKGVGLGRKLSFSSLAKAVTTKEDESGKVRTFPQPISLSTQELLEINALLSSGITERETNSNPVDETTGERTNAKEGLGFRFSTPFDTNALNSLISDSKVLALEESTMSAESDTNTEESVPDDASSSSSDTDAAPAGAAAGAALPDDAQDAGGMKVPPSRAGVFPVGMRAVVLERLEQKRESRRGRFASKPQQNFKAEHEAEAKPTTTTATATATAAPSSPTMATSAPPVPARPSATNTSPAVSRSPSPAPTIPDKPTKTSNLPPGEPSSSSSSSSSEPKGPQTSPRSTFQPASSMPSMPTNASGTQRVFELRDQERGRRSPSFDGLASLASPSSPSLSSPSLSSSASSSSSAAAAAASSSLSSPSLLSSDRPTSLGLSSAAQDVGLGNSKGADSPRTSSHSRQPNPSNPSDQSRPFYSILDHVSREYLTDYDIDSQELGPVYVLSDDETKITAATMAKLVSHLADEKAADIDFVNVFLLTYRRYASPFQLLAFLEKRFFLDPPPDASQEILDAFSNCRKVVMVRVVNVLRRWMEEFPFDFTPDLLRAFRTFRDTAYEREPEVRRYISILTKVLRQFDLLQESTPISSNLEEKLNGIALAMKHPTSTLLKASKKARFGSLKKPKTSALVNTFLGSDMLEWIMLNVLNPVTPSSEESDKITSYASSGTSKHQQALSIALHMLDLGLIEQVFSPLSSLIASSSSASSSSSSAPNSSPVASPVVHTASSSSSSFSLLDDSNRDIVFLPDAYYAVTSSETSNTFADLQVVDIANFLTFTEHRLLKKITVNELQNCAWSSKEKEERAPNIVKFTLHHRRIAVWAASEIILAINSKQRKANIEKFILLCEALRRLNNFNGLMEIIGGLTISKACKSAWKLVPKKMLQSFYQMEGLFVTANNFSNYRTEIRMIEKSATNTPCVPFLGLILQDVTFIEENPDYKTFPQFPDRKLINFAKCSVLADVYRTLLHFQSIPIGIPEAKAWGGIESLIQSSYIFDEKKIHNLATQVESGIIG